MSEEITASMTFSAEGLMPGLRWHNHRFNRKLKIVSVTSVVMLVVFLLAPKGNPNLPLFSSMIWAPVVPLLLVGWLAWAMRSGFARSVRSTSANGKLISYVIREDGVRVSLPDSNAENEWSHFVRSVITPEGVLLYPQQLAFHWLPKTAFTSEADYTRFVDLVAAKTKHTKLG